jgi:undecaprenyl-diphosphatase
LIARRIRTRRRDGLTRRRALILGAVQGPAELLPVSSSAHVSLVPWFAGWRMDGTDPEARKSFEVALHAGTAAALLVGQRRAVATEIGRLNARRAAAIAMSLLPPAVVGYGLERQIERRLGGPRTIAAGLLAGSIAMLVADRAPQERGSDELGAADGLALGVAQAAALLPGVSRNGATVAAARLRRFRRADANLLSRIVALPVILGATALKGVRIGRRAPDRSTRSAIASGAVASFGSTLAAQGLMSLTDRDRSPWPFAAYRGALAAAVLLRLRNEKAPAARDG